MRALFTLALLLSAGNVRAQTAAALSGGVHDRTGAVLAAAKITARHTDTGLSRTALTDGDGHFIFPALPAGEYELRAETRGFRPLVRKGIHLTVAENVALDLTLELGPIDQEITVTAEAPLVNTQTAELSYLVSDGAMRELPLNGRNFTDLALLQPGVISFPYRDGGSVVAHGLGMSMNGQDPRSNVYLLDGTPQNDFTNGPAGSAAGTVLGIETIREFRVEVNNYSAEFGRNSGGQINVLSKSGTNQLHGSLYEFHRHDNLDARDFFDRQKPSFKRNQFGGTVGGPLHADRDFFFLGYEALRERKGRTVSTVVPDANARNGVLPGLTVPVSPVIQPFLDSYPLPNGENLGDGTARYLFGFNQSLGQDFGQSRYDHNIGADSQFFVRYTFDGGEQRLPTDYPQFPRSFISRNQFVTAEYRQILSPAALNTFRTGFSRTRIAQGVEANLASPLPSFVPGRGMPGGIDIGGFPGRWGPQTSVDVRLTQNVFGFEDALSYTHAKHALKAGMLAERYQDNMVNPTFGLGIFTFRGLSDFLQNRPQRFVGLTPSGALDRYWRFTLFGFYVQDNFRVLPRLVLNLGLRYEFSTQPLDLYGRDSALIHLSDPAPAVGPLYENPTKKNLSPRFGFAWDVAGDGRTAVRGGYGWIFNTNNQQNLIVTVTNPPATPRIVIANPTFPVPPFDRGIGNSIRPIEFNIKNPNVHQWNVNIQRQLPGDVLVTLGYAGARGIHLLRNGDVNIPEPVRQPDGNLVFPLNAPRPNANFSTVELKRSDGNSWYNAMIVEGRRRWGRGFNVQSSYTFSRNIDTTQSSTFFSDATNGTTSAFPEYPGFHYNKGLADYHSKHNWIMNFSWEIPFAKGLGRTGRAVLDGWQLTGIGQVRSGNPLTLFEVANRSRSLWAPSLAPGQGVDRPSMAPGFTHQSAILGSPDGWFDRAAFALQPAGQLGNLGRGALIGPNLRNFDLAALKGFRWSKLGDSSKIQFRVESFNLFNRPNFGPPSLQAFNGAADNEKPLASLGLVRTTITSSRQIQLGLRVAF